MYIKRVLAILTTILLTFFINHSCSKEKSNNLSHPFFCTDHVDSLLSLSQDLIFGGSLVKAIKCANNAYSIAVEQGDKLKEAEASLYLATSLFYIGSYKHSLNYIEKLSANPAATPELRVDAGRIKQRIYFKLELDDSDEKNFNELFKLLRSFKNRDEALQRRALLYNDISRIHLRKGDTTLSLNFLKKSKSLLENDTSRFSNYLFTSITANLVTIYSSMGDFDSSQQVLDEAYGRVLNSNYPYLHKLLVVEGDLEAQKKNYQKAIEFYYSATANLKELNIKDELPPIYRKISLTYRLLGNTTDSARYYSHLVDITNAELVGRKYGALKEINSLLSKTNREKNSLLVFIFYTPFILFSLLLLATGSALTILKFRKKRLNLALKRKEQHIDMFKSLELGQVDYNFQNTFKLLYPQFSDKLRATHRNLTESEESLCKLIFLELTSKEIAKTLYLEHRTVQTKKSRLRKSLQLSKGEDLETYLAKFK